MKKRAFITLIVLLFSLSSFSQTTRERIAPLRQYFRLPMNFPLGISGSFGELRPNHFHTGLDMKTGAEEGIPVYACADGYISRIGISAGGYGNCLYIDHPVGLTTVYAHLFSFSEVIKTYAIKQQYLQERFDLQYHPKPQDLLVKKGQLIGYSGNTGGSAGPHLHFEIRDTKSEHPLNPGLFGLMPSDSVNPTVVAIKLYPARPGSYITATYATGNQVKVEYGQNILIPASKYKGNYTLPLKTLECAGEINISVESYDRDNSMLNTLGVYSTELCIDGDRTWYQELGEIDFAFNKHVNAHVDFAQRFKNKRWFERLYKLPLNRLSLYDPGVGSGTILIKENQNHKVNIYFTDLDGNQTLLFFTIKGKPAKKIDQSKKVDVQSYSTYNLDKSIIPGQSKSFSSGDYKVTFSDSSAYDTLEYIYSKLPPPVKGYSAIHSILLPSIPIFRPYELEIKLTKPLPEIPLTKVGLISGRGAFIKARVNGDMVVATCPVSDKWYVYFDTTKPTIFPLNIKQGTNFANKKAIIIKLGDNLSGLQTFRGEIDGRWVLFTFDDKTRQAIYIFDDKCPPGSHKLTMTATDYCGNQNVFRAGFTR